MFFNTDAANAFFLRGTEYDPSLQHQDEAPRVPRAGRARPASAEPTSTTHGVGASQSSAPFSSNRTRQYLEALRNGSRARGRSSSDGGLPTTTGGAPGGAGRLSLTNNYGLMEELPMGSFGVSSNTLFSVNAPAYSSGSGGRTAAYGSIPRAAGTTAATGATPLLPSATRHNRPASVPNRPIPRDSDSAQAILRVAHPQRPVSPYYYDSVRRGLQTESDGVPDPAAQPSHSSLPSKARPNPHLHAGAATRHTPSLQLPTSPAAIPTAGGNGTPTRALGINTPAKVASVYNTPGIAINELQGTHPPRRGSLGDVPGSKRPSLSNSSLDHGLVGGIPTSSATAAALAMAAMGAPLPRRASPPTEAIPVAPREPWSVEVVLTTVADESLATDTGAQGLLGTPAGNIAVTLSTQDDLILVSTLHVQPPQTLLRLLSAASEEDASAGVTPDAAQKRARGNRRSAYEALVTFLKKSIASALSLQYLPREYYYYDQDFRQYVRLTPETTSLAPAEGLFRVVVVSATGNLPRELTPRPSSQGSGAPARQEAVRADNNGDRATSLFPRGTQTAVLHDDAQDDVYHEQPWTAPVLTTPAPPPVPRPASRRGSSAFSKERPPFFARHFTVPVPLATPLSASLFPCHRPEQEHHAVQAQSEAAADSARASGTTSPQRPPSQASSALARSPSGLRSSLPAMQQELWMWRQQQQQQPPQQRGRPMSASVGSTGDAVLGPVPPVSPKTSSGVQRRLPLEEHEPPVMGPRPSNVTAAGTPAMQPVPPSEPRPISHDDVVGDSGESTGSFSSPRRFFRLNELYNPEQHYYYGDGTPWQDLQQQEEGDTRTELSEEPMHHESRSQSADHHQHHHTDGVLEEAQKDKERRHSLDVVSEMSHTAADTVEVPVPPEPEVVQASPVTEGEAGELDTQGSLPEGTNEEAKEAVEDEAPEVEDTLLPAPASPMQTPEQPGSPFEMDSETEEPASPAVPEGEDFDQHQELKEEHESEDVQREAPHHDEEDITAIATPEERPEPDHGGGDPYHRFAHPLPTSDARSPRQAEASDVEAAAEESKENGETGEALVLDATAVQEEERTGEIPLPDIASPPARTPSPEPLAEPEVNADATEDVDATTTPTEPHTVVDVRGVVPGEAWGELLERVPNTLTQLARNDVKALYGCGDDAITNLRFTLGSLHLSYDYTHCTAAPDAKIRGMSEMYDYPSLRYLHAQRDTILAVLALDVPATASSPTSPPPQAPDEMNGEEQAAEQSETLEPAQKPEVMVGTPERAQPLAPEEPEDGENHEEEHQEGEHEEEGQNDESQHEEDHAPRTPPSPASPQEQSDVASQKSKASVHEKVSEVILEEPAEAAPEAPCPLPTATTEPEPQPDPEHEQEAEENHTPQGLVDDEEEALPYVTAEQPPAVEHNVQEEEADEGPPAPEVEESPQSTVNEEATNAEEEHDDDAGFEELAAKEESVVLPTTETAEAESRSEEEPLQLVETDPHNEPTATLTNDEHAEVSSTDAPAPPAQHTAASEATEEKKTSGEHPLLPPQEDVVDQLDDVAPPQPPTDARQDVSSVPRVLSRRLPIMSLTSPPDASLLVTRHDHTNGIDYDTDDGIDAPESKIYDLDTRTQSTDFYGTVASHAAATAMEESATTAHEVLVTTLTELIVAQEEGVTSQEEVKDDDPSVAPASVTVVPDATTSAVADTDNAAPLEQQDLEEQQEAEALLEEVMEAQPEALPPMECSPAGPPPIEEAEVAPGAGVTAGPGEAPLVQPTAALAELAVAAVATLHSTDVDVDSRSPAIESPAMESSPTESALRPEHHLSDPDPLPLEVKVAQMHEASVASTEDEGEEKEEAPLAEEPSPTREDSWGQVVVPEVQAIPDPQPLESSAFDEAAEETAGLAAPPTPTPQMEEPERPVAGDTDPWRELGENDDDDSTPAPPAAPAAHETSEGQAAAAINTEVATPGQHVFEEHVAEAGDYPAETPVEEAAVFTAHAFGEQRVGVDEYPSDNGHQMPMLSAHNSAPAQTNFTKVVTEELSQPADAVMYPADRPVPPTLSAEEVTRTRHVFEEIMAEMNKSPVPVPNSDHSVANEKSSHDSGVLPPPIALTEATHGERQDELEEEQQAQEEEAEVQVVVVDGQAMPLVDANTREVSPDGTNSEQFMAVSTGFPVAVAPTADAAPFAEEEESPVAVVAPATEPEVEYPTEEGTTAAEVIAPSVPPPHAVESEAHESLPLAETSGTMTYSVDSAEDAYRAHGGAAEGAGGHVAPASAEATPDRLAAEGTPDGDTADSPGVPESDDLLSPAEVDQTPAGTPALPEEGMTEGESSPHHDGTHVALAQPDFASADAAEAQEPEAQERQQTTAETAEEAPWHEMRETNDSVQEDAASEAHAQEEAPLVPAPKETDDSVPVDGSEAEVPEGCVGGVEPWHEIGDAGEPESTGDTAAVPIPSPVLHTVDGVDAAQPSTTEDAADPPATAEDQWHEIGEGDDDDAAAVAAPAGEASPESPDTPEVAEKARDGVPVATSVEDAPEPEAAEAAGASQPEEVPQADEMVDSAVPISAIEDEDGSVACPPPRPETLSPNGVEALQVEQSTEPGALLINTESEPPAAAATYPADEPQAPYEDVAPLSCVEQATAVPPGAVPTTAQEEGSSEQWHVSPDDPPAEVKAHEQEKEHSTKLESSHHDSLVSYESVRGSPHKRKGSRGTPDAYYEIGDDPAHERDDTRELTQPIFGEDDGPFNGPRTAAASPRLNAEAADAATVEQLPTSRRSAEEENREEEEDASDEAAETAAAAEKDAEYPQEAPAHDTTLTDPATDAATTTSMQKLGFLGNSWSYVLENYFAELDVLFRQEVGTALGLGPDCVKLAEYTEGSLMVDFYVTTPTSTTADATKQMLIEYEYAALWEFYGRMRKEHKRVLRQQQAGGNAGGDNAATAAEESHAVSRPGLSAMEERPPAP